MQRSQSDLWRALSILKEIRDTTKRTVGKREFMVENDKAFNQAMIAAEQMLEDHRFETDQKPQR